jgi:hypothetical protein
MLAIPQLSELPPSRLVIEAEPPELMFTVWFTQTALGASLSETVTLKEQLAVLPEASVATKETEEEPTANKLPLAPPDV